MATAQPLSLRHEHNLSCQRLLGRNAEFESASVSQRQLVEVSEELITLQHDFRPACVARCGQNCLLNVREESNKWAVRYPISAAQDIECK